MSNIPDEPEATIQFRNPIDHVGFARISHLVTLNHALSCGAYRLYGVLLIYARQSRHAFPGQDRLARHLGVTDRCVRNWLKELETEKLLTIDQRGLTQTNRYWIEEPKVPKTLTEEEQNLLFGPSTNDRNTASDQTGNTPSDRNEISEQARNEISDKKETELRRNKEQQLQRCTRAETPAAAKEKRATPEPPTPDPIIVALAAACPRASTTGPAFGKVVAWCKEHGKTAEWIGGFAEWFQSEHEDWTNPTPAPCQLIQFSETYDEILRAAAEEEARRMERRRRSEEYSRQQSLEYARLEAEFLAEVERQKTAGTYQKPKYKAFEAVQRAAARRGSSGRGAAA